MLMPRLRLMLNGPLYDLYMDPYVNPYTNHYVNPSVIPM